MNYSYIDSVKLERVKKLLAKSKISDVFSETNVTSEDKKFMRRFSELLELEIMLHWNEQTSLSSDDLSQFKQLCMHMYELLLVNGPATENHDDVKHFIRLMSYAYVAEHGEKSRAVADRLISTETSLDPNVWSERVLAKIYRALLHLVRKNGWNDLTETVSIINSLREEQAEYEEIYLSDSTESGRKTGLALEIAALYHLAKSVEIVADFQIDGSPSDATEQLSLQLDYASQYSKQGGLYELNLLISVVEVSLKKVIANSIWVVGQRINSRVTKFLEALKSSQKPLLELLYPQREAILNQGLLDPAHSAIVVNLPTSSGKTLVAEFKILQSLNQFENAWVAYVAPTKALVNQITAQLKMDLGRAPLSLRVESMSGAIEIDTYEEAIINNNSFDILVTTPEKMNLLIRRGIEDSMGRPLALAVIDEAHNIGSSRRGINLELLLSNIRHDCTSANVLLLTPFVPNSEEIANWLSPDTSSSISLSLNWWKPNDHIVGAVKISDYSSREYAETNFAPMITSRSTLQTEDLYNIGHSSIDYTGTELGKKYRIAALSAVQFDSTSDKLVIARTTDDTYKIADMILELDDLAETRSSDVEIVKKYVASEMGADFPLVGYLDKGIGIHHGGLPDDIRSMMEYLMREGQLKYLVATTTIAQGMNFNTSSIFMSGYWYPGAKMPYFDFWNLVGRTGRLHQKGVGLVGIACKTDADISKLSNYLGEAAGKVVSNLKEMVENAITASGNLDLDQLYWMPEWSNFLQYIAHMYNQSQNLRNFEAQIQITMKRTLGFHQLNNEKRQLLIEGVRRYAQKLDENPGLSKLSDLTGFSPETIRRTINQSRMENISITDWEQSNLFTQNSASLKKLINIMMKAPEIKGDLSELIGDTPSLSQTRIANMITDWVQGKSMERIANEHFAHLPNATDRLTRCVKAIHKHLINSSAWGLAAVQRSGGGIDFDSLSDAERRKLTDIPAMVYYGVNSSEAIALRKAKLPRKMSIALSERLKRNFGDNLYQTSGSDVESWLNNLGERSWSSTTSGALSGLESKRVWQMLQVS